MKTYVTLTKKFDNYKIKITQDYNTEFNFGHYIIIFEDLNGNIIDSIQTTGGVPHGKINNVTLHEHINKFKEMNSAGK